MRAACAAYGVYATSLLLLACCAASLLSCLLLFLWQDKSKRIGGPWVAAFASARLGHAPGMSIGVDIENSFGISTIDVP